MKIERQALPRITPWSPIQTWRSKPPQKQMGHLVECVLHDIPYVFSPTYMYIIQERLDM